MGAIFNVGIFMSPVQEMKDRLGKCIFYGSLPQETGELTPMLELDPFLYILCHTVGTQKGHSPCDQNSSPTYQPAISASKSQAPCYTDHGPPVAALYTVYLTSVYIFSRQRYYLPLEKKAPRSNKLKSSSNQNALCQVWLKMVKWFMRRTDRQMDWQTTDNTQP